MRELAVRIDAVHLEEALDALLPLAPRGIHDIPLAGGEIELRLRGATGELPAPAQLASVLAGTGRAIVEREVSDDWRVRRELDYAPLVLGGRLVVRPEWAPPPAAGLLDIAIPDATAFGRGGHPTTRACLEALLELAPGGPFADLGCGSGVLAVAAARLGYAPVVALDVEDVAVETARAAALLNGVALEARRADLLSEPPPAAATMAANVPAAVHVVIAASLPEVPRALLVSGLQQPDVERVLAAYAARGLAPTAPVAGDAEWPLIRLAPASG